MHALKITWYFYKPIWVWCLLATLFCIYYVLRKELNIPFACLCKLASYSAILGLQYLNSNATKSYFYFRNAGYNINRLYLYAFGLDFIAFIILLSISTIR